MESRYNKGMANLWNKLKALLTNTWMNSVTYLAAMAHIGWAALILVSVAFVSNTSLATCAYASVGLVVFAAIKEYGYDANFELPKQTWKDNTQDFAGYVGGVALAWGVILLHLHMPAPHEVKHSRDHGAEVTYGEDLQIP